MWTNGLREQEQISYQAMLGRIGQGRGFMPASLLPARLTGAVGKQNGVFIPANSSGATPSGTTGSISDHLCDLPAGCLRPHGVGGGAVCPYRSSMPLRPRKTPSGALDFFVIRRRSWARSTVVFKWTTRIILYFSAWVRRLSPEKKPRFWSFASRPGHPPAILLGPDSAGAKRRGSLWGPAALPGKSVAWTKWFNRSGTHPGGSRLAIVCFQGRTEFLKSFSDNEKVGTWEEFFASFQFRGNQKT